MRKAILILAATVFTIGTVRADDTAKDIIAKAVAAHGGAETINKYPAGRVKSSGTIMVADIACPYTTEFSYSMPDKVRNVLTVTLAGQKRTVVQLQAGDKIQFVVDNGNRAATADDLKRFKQGLYVQNLVRIAPLLDDKTYTLTLAGEEKVNEQPAVGVKVTSAGNDPVTLWFDKKSNLLVRASRMGFDNGGQKVPQEEFFSDYQETKGIKQPVKTVVFQNGKKHIEGTVSLFNPLEKIETSEFITP